MIKNKLAQLAKAERYIAQFQLLSNIHARTLSHHNDQLEYSWKDGYGTAERDFKTLIDAASKNTEEVNEQNKMLRQALSECTDKPLVLTKQLTQEEIDKYSQSLATAHISGRIEPIGVIAATQDSGFIIHNWRDSWKWISNWCFGLIAFFATTPIPPEVLAVLPENIRYYVIAWIAFCGFVGRYINQSKPVHLPPVDTGDANV